MLKSNCNFKYKVHFNENKKNYWASIDFFNTNVSNDNEKDIYIIVEKAIAESFKFENGDIPFFNYKTNKKLNQKEEHILSSKVWPTSQRGTNLN